jgi:hypothetical protein
MTGRKVRVRFLAKGRDLFILCSVQTGAAVKPASCPMGTGRSSSGGKAARGMKLTTNLPIVFR